MGIPGANKRKRAIRVLIIEDHEMFRNLLADHLSKRSNILVSGCYGEGHKALQFLESHTCDVALVDLELPDMHGIELIEAMQDRFKEVNIVVLSMHTEAAIARKVIAQGALGFVAKGSDIPVLMNAIELAAKSRPFIDRVISGAVPDKTNRNRPGPDILHFTTRELQIIQLISEGYKSRGIAVALGLSLRTVDTHRRNILKKFGMKGMANVTKWCSKNGLIR